MGPTGALTWKQETEYSLRGKILLEQPQFSTNSYDHKTFKIMEWTAFLN